jgi:hypothetical protein
MVVVENDNTFHSVHHVLTEEPGPVGHIAWGVGGTFEASVRSTDDLPGVKRVRYFGDLDADGLRIPRNAAATADHESLPPVLPAIGLYRALLETSVRHHGQTTTSPSQANNLAAWLADSFLVQEAASLLVSGVRIPQEALTRTALARDRSWLADM